MTHGKRLAAFVAVALSWAGLASSTVANAQGVITWQVHNRFRLFDDPDAAVREQVISKENRLLDTIAAREDLKSAYPYYYPLLIRSQSGLNLYQHTRYNRDVGDYSAFGSFTDHYVAPAYQAVDAKVSGTPAGALCSWMIDQPLVSTATNISCTTTAALKLTLSPSISTFSGTISVSIANAPPISVSVTTRDRLIVGLGDSYAAGEGSPDRPVDVRNFHSVPLNLQLGRPDLWWMSSKLTRGPLPSSASADWWSPECHRSLFSPQVVAALRIAATHPQGTFISCACAGASVLDGLLTPQAAPPGEEHIQVLRDEGHGDAEGIEGRAVEQSQLRQTVDTLCRGAITEEEYEFPAQKIPTWLNILYDRAQQNDPNIPECASWKRTPDLIFLTIGGNDVGLRRLGNMGRFS